MVAGGALDLLFKLGPGFVGRWSLLVAPMRSGLSAVLSFIVLS